MTVGLHISVRAGPTITSANLAIHYDSSDHEEPTRPAPPTTTTTTTPASNVTGTGTTTAAATTTAAPTTAAPTTTAAASAGPNPAPRLYTSSTGTDDDTPITSYEKVVVQQVSSDLSLEGAPTRLHLTIKNNNTSLVSYWNPFFTAYIFSLSIFLLRLARIDAPPLLTTEVL